MSRGRLLLLILLSAQVCLCAALLVGEFVLPCGACSRGPNLLALLGLVLYGILAIRLRFSGLSEDVHFGILLAAGVHIALGVRMLIEGPFCILCATAAALSLAMVAVSSGLDRTHSGRLAALLPAAAFLVSIGSFAAMQAPVVRPLAKQVRIQVFTQPDCPYCETLERELMPEIQKEFGRRIATEYRSADDLASVRRTPTLILHGHGSSPAMRVIEGLPTLERLRGVIRDLEATP